MPVLTNTRHERYAQELAKGMSQSDAFVAAGYKANDGNASRLKGNEKIQARIRELQERAAVKTEITLEKLTSMLLEDRELARRSGQSAAAVSAVEKLGKLHGYFVDRAVNENVSYVVSGEPIDDPDEWIREHGPRH